MIYRKLLLITAGVLLLAFYSCTDNPTAVGSQLLGRDAINLKQLDSMNDSLNQQSSYFKRTLPLGAGTRLLVGKYNNNLTASSLIEFYVVMQDSMKDDLLAGNLVVTSSVVSLYPIYTFGDSTAPFNLNVYKITSPWLSTGFDADSLPYLTHENTELSSNQVFTDSLATFDLDKNLTLNWLKDAVDSNYSDNMGIYIAPGAGTSKVIGFQALSSTSSNATMLTVILQKPGVYTDTLIYYPTQDVSTVTGSIRNSNPQDIIVQGGLVSEGRLWFDLSKIPAHALINSATLTLTLDSTQTVLGSTYTNNLLVSNLVDTTLISTDSTQTLTLTQSGNTYSGNITPFVQSWIDSGINEGLLVTCPDELSGMEIFAIKGSNAADRSVRPRLKITYTYKN